MYYILSFIFYAVPSAVVFAQGTPTDFASLVDQFLAIIDILIVLIFALTFIVFIWGITKAWIINAGDETEIENGKQLALWGVIGLVVMSGIWGLLSLLRYSLFGG